MSGVTASPDQPNTDDDKPGPLLPVQDDPNYSDDESAWRYLVVYE